MIFDIEPPYIISSVLIFVVSLVAYLYSRSNDHLAKGAGLCLPPGPKRLFLLDNLFNYPQKDADKIFTEWKDKYGDIVYVNVLGIPMVVCNSLAVADEFANYSNRPTTVMATKLLDVTWTLVMAQPSSSVNEMRKVLKKEIGPHSVAQYDTVFYEEAENLVRELCNFSGGVLDRIEDIVAAVIIKVGYGSHVFKEHGEELIQLDKDMVTYVTWILKQLWVVDIFPFLQYLPSWFPGASFHHVAKKGRDYLDRGRNDPFNMVKSALSKGINDASICSKYLQSLEFDANLVRDAVSQLYGAGVDTTATVIANYLYNMVLYPDVQRRVQRELDTNIGHGRIPTIEECYKLEYHNAVWKESLRMHAPAPLGVPHSSVEADAWNGFYIPKGTIIHCNIGCIMRDPRVWGDNASEFFPDRFLSQPGVNDLPDPSSVAFGFGRRVCPGQTLAQRVSILFTAALLSSYDIVTVSGEGMPHDMEWDDSTVRTGDPASFDVI